MGGRGRVFEKEGIGTKMKVSESSLLYWFPKVKNLGFRVPRTIFLPIPDLDRHEYVDGDGACLEPHIGNILKCAKLIGYPLFLRTDLASGKHNWNKSCYVEKEEDLISHVREVLEFNYMADILGLPCKALVFREYIPLESYFVAFWGEMPVAKERRVFVRDGKVICHHAYWVEAAIVDGTRRVWNKLPTDWKEILDKKINAISIDEEAHLLKYALLVAKAIKGYWSVDFAKAKTGEWVLIDMGKGECSWHQEDCEFNTTAYKEDGEVEIEL